MKEVQNAPSKKSFLQKTKYWLIGIFALLVIVFASLIIIQNNTVQPIDHWSYIPIASVKLNDDGQIILTVRGSSKECREGNYVFDHTYDDDTLTIDVKGIKYFGDNYYYYTGDFYTCTPFVGVTSKLYLDNSWVAGSNEPKIIVKGNEKLQGTYKPSYQEWQDTFELLSDDETAKINLIWTTRKFEFSNYPKIPYELPKLNDFPKISFNVDNNNPTLKLVYLDTTGCSDGEILSSDKKEAFNGENLFHIKIKGLMYSDGKKDCKESNLITKNIVLDKETLSQKDLKITLETALAEQNYPIRRTYTLKPGTKNEPEMKPEFTLYPTTEISASLARDPLSPFVTVSAKNDYCLSSGEIKTEVSKSKEMTIYVYGIESTDTKSAISSDCAPQNFYSTIYIPNELSYYYKIGLTNTFNTDDFDRYKKQSIYDRDDKDTGD